MDATRKELRRPHQRDVIASASTITEIFGIGPMMAAIIIGHTGDVRRFPTASPLRPTQRHRTDRHIG